MGAASGSSSRRSASEKIPVALTVTFARIRWLSPVSASRAMTPQVWPLPPSDFTISMTSIPFSTTAP